MATLNKAADQQPHICEAIDEARQLDRKRATTKLC